MTLRPAATTELTGHSSTEPTTPEQRCASPATGATELTIQPTTHLTATESFRALKKHRKHHEMFRDESETEPDGPDLRLLVRDDRTGEPIQWVISGRRAQYSQSAQCYWCWRWRVTRWWHLICEKCTAESEQIGAVYWWQLVWSERWTNSTGAVYWNNWQIQPTGALDHNGNTLNLNHFVNRSNPNWKPFNKNWNLLTRAVVDGRVYASGLLGWLQSPRARGSRLTRCFVTNPLCDRCQALVEPPRYPNNKHRAVRYFQRVLGQQQESFSYIFAMHAEALAAYLANAWEP